MIATDSLSLVFLACFLFGLIFLLVTALLGSLGHGHIGDHAAGHHFDLHLGAHDSHVVGHVGGHAPVQAGAHGAAHGPLHPGAHSTGQETRTAVPTQGNGLALLSYINPTSIVLFLLGFGFFGYVFHTTAHFVLPLTLALAGVSGLVITGLMLLLLARLFGDSEGATVQDVSDRTGLLGKVSVTIQENGLGEIIYVSPGGMRKSIPARSIDGRRLERDQEVVVVNYARGVAEVDTWDNIINEEESTATEAPFAGELAKLRALLEESGKADTELVMRKDLQKE
jgi:hypothetical protein